MNLSSQLGDFQLGDAQLGDAFTEAAPPPPGPSAVVEDVSGYWFDVPMQLAIGAAAGE